MTMEEEEEEEFEIMKCIVSILFYQRLIIFAAFKGGTTTYSSCEATNTETCKLIIRLLTKFQLNFLLGLKIHWEIQGLERSWHLSSRGSSTGSGIR